MLIGGYSASKVDVVYVHIHSCSSISLGEVPFPMRKTLASKRHETLSQNTITTFTLLIGQYIIGWSQAKDRYRVSTARLTIQSTNHASINRNIFYYLPCPLGREGWCPSRRCMLFFLTLHNMQTYQTWRFVQNVVVFLTSSRVWHAHIFFYVRNRISTTGRKHFHNCIPAYLLFPAVSNFKYATFWRKFAS